MALTTSQSTISGITLPTLERNEEPPRNQMPSDCSEPSTPTNNVSPATNSEGATLQPLSSGIPSSVPICPARRVVALAALDEEQERLLNQGYDSDGVKVPFFDAVQDEVDIDDYDEDPFEMKMVVTTLNELMETEDDVAEANLLTEVKDNIEGDNAPGQEGDDQSDPVTTEAECVTLSVK